MTKELTVEDTKSYWGSNRGVHSWVHNGVRLVASAQRHYSPELRLYKFEGGALTLLATFSVPHNEISYTVTGTVFNQDSIIVLGSYGASGDHEIFILKWDGENLTTETSQSFVNACYYAYSWIENGSVMIAATNENGFRIYKWNGTSLTNEASVSWGLSCTKLHVWEEAGNRMIVVTGAVNHKADDYILYRWDGQNLVSVAEYTTGTTTEGVHSWVENGNRMIALGSGGATYIVKWDGNTLSQQATFSKQPGTVHSWEEDGDRMLACGRSVELFFLRWDGQNLIEEQIDAAGRTNIRGVYSWEEDEDRLIATVDDSGNNRLTIFRWAISMFPPSLSVVQVGDIIQATIEEGEPE